MGQNCNSWQSGHNLNCIWYELPQLTQLPVGFAAWWHRFSPTEVHLRFMVHKMAMGMAQTYLHTPLFLLHYLQFHQYSRLQYYVTMSYPQLLPLSFSAHSACD